MDIMLLSGACIDLYILLLCKFGLFKVYAIANLLLHVWKFLSWNSCRNLFIFSAVAGYIARRLYSMRGFYAYDISNEFVLSNCFQIMHVIRVFACVF